MTDPKDDLQEIAAEIARIVSGNRKFLSRLMDDDGEFADGMDDGEESEDVTPVG